MKKYPLRVSVLLLAIGLIIFGLCRGLRFYWLKWPPATFPLTLTWAIDLGRSTYERPAYLDGLVLMPVDTWLTSQWYGIDAATGQVVWSRNTGKEAGRYNFRRCLTSEYLVVSGQLSLYVLNPQTGDLVWGGNKGEGGHRASTATCTKDAIVVGNPRNPLYAFSISTGQPLWATNNLRINLDNPIYNPEADEVIAYGPEGILNTVDAKKGILIQSFERVAIPPYEQWRGSMYLIDQGQLFIGGTVLEATTGQLIHKEDRYDGLVPPTLFGQTIYLSDSQEGVVALDRETFTVKWIYQPQRKVAWLPLVTLSAVTILDDIGYVIFSDATLRAFDLATGQELGYWQPESLDLWTWPICGTPLVPGCVKYAKVGLTASDDTLFVSFGDGKLYAFSRLP